jgi:hypothetical protein
MLNTQLPRFNAKWRDPHCEDVDCLHLPDAALRRENNYCNPPWTALPTLPAKLRQLSAVATVVAPYWPNKPWYQDLHRLATQNLHFPPSRDLFFHGRLGRHTGVGPPGWSIMASRLTPLRGSTHAATL